MTFKFFPAFFDHPAKIQFADAETDEHIELLLRQHWVTNISWIVSAFFLAILPVALLRISFVQSLLQPFQIPFNITATGLVLWYMFVLAFIIGKFLYWYFNIYIVTNTHLIDVRFQNLLSKTVTEVLLDDVQSSKAKLQGILGSLFNFGDVIVETAAEKQNIQFLSIPNPDAVKERIQDVKELQEGTS